MFGEIALIAIVFGNYSVYTWVARLMVTIPEFEFARREQLTEAVKGTAKVGRRSTIHIREGTRAAECASG